MLNPNLADVGKAAHGRRPLALAAGRRARMRLQCDAGRALPDISRVVSDSDTGILFLVSRCFRDLFRVHGRLDSLPFVGRFGAAKGQVCEAPFVRCSELAVAGAAAFCAFGEA